MKIALVQLNPIVGDVAGNTRKIRNFIKKAVAAKCDLVVFPEMAVLGYPPRDLLEVPSLVTKARRAIDELAIHAKGITVIVGGVEINAGPGKPLFNAAFWLSDGKIQKVFRKSLLPFYDVFDETRYFESNKNWEIIEFGNTKIGVTICEDIWSNEAYDVNPVEKLVGLGATMIINLSASPYSMAKFSVRHKMIQNLARTHHVTVAYVNQFGGNDELVFDGGSMVADSSGEIISLAPFFKEGMIVVDLDQSESISFHTPDELELLSQALVTGLRDYVKKCGFKKVTLGLSGGIDSAVVAALAVKALGAKNVLGVLMPSRYTSKASNIDALLLAKNLKIKTRTIPIAPMQKAFEATFKKMFKGKKLDTTEENIQARIRGNILMAISNKEGHMVLSTGNKSELAVGYCTLYGDMSGGLNVIADVPKTLVYKLAHHLNKKKNIPSAIFTKAPTAELRPNQTDQDSLPPYEILDGILKLAVEDLKSDDEIIKLGFDKKIVQRVLAMIHRNEYKRRQAAPGIRVTSKAFGMGRRFPIACRF